MGTKNEPGEFDCYAAAEPDEPMFIISRTIRYRITPQGRRALDDRPRAERRP